MNSPHPRPVSPFFASAPPQIQVFYKDKGVRPRVDATTPLATTPAICNLYHYAFKSSELYSKASAGPGVRGMCSPGTAGSSSPCIPVNPSAGIAAVECR